MLNNIYFIFILSVIKVVNNVFLIDWKRNFIYFNLLMNNKISDIVYWLKSYCKCVFEN